MHLFINTFILDTHYRPWQKNDQDDKENANTKQKLRLIAFPLSFFISIMPNSDRLSHVPVLYGCRLLIATTYTCGRRLDEAVFPLFIYTKRLFPWKSGTPGRWGNPFMFGGVTNLMTFCLLVCLFVCLFVWMICKGCLFWHSIIRL